MCVWRAAGARGAEIVGKEGECSVVEAGSGDLSLTVLDRDSFRASRFSEAVIRFAPGAPFREVLATEETAGRNEVPGFELEYDTLECEDDGPCQVAGRYRCRSAEWTDDVPTTPAIGSFVVSLADTRANGTIQAECPGGRLEGDPNETPPGVVTIDLSFRGIEAP